MRPCLPLIWDEALRVDEKVFKRTCTSDSKLVVLDMFKQKCSLHFLTNQCVHQQIYPFSVWRLKILVPETKE